MTSTLLILTIAFFFIALIYASVGFGGGSSYLALLAVMGLGMEIIRPSALLCNVVVVTSGTFIFFKEGKLEWRRCWPFLLTSIPAAFLGGFWKLNEHTFFIILALSLAVAGMLLLVQPPVPIQERQNSHVLNLSLGGGVGFLSGLVGIGGGIFLSPILHLLKWDEARKISALASLFILVNSISGLAGQFSRAAAIDWKFIFPLLLSVFIGGQIGSRLGARRFDQRWIKKITGILIIVAGLNILKDHWVG